MDLKLLVTYSVIIQHSDKIRAMTKYERISIQKVVEICEKFKFVRKDWLLVECLPYSVNVEQL
jgi:hypothetical protein